MSYFDSMFNMFDPEEEPEPQDPLMELMKSYKAPPRPKLDAYSQMLEQIPQRQDYEMSTGGKIGSALVAGLAGLTAKSGQDAANFGMQLRDRPYNQAMQDFAVKAKGAKEAAELEDEVAKEREHVFNQMFEMGDKITDNSRADKETSIRNFRANMMDKYLEHKRKRDDASAIHKQGIDDRRAKAAEIQAGAAVTRANAAAERVKQAGNKPAKPPTESAKVTAKKQAMDYLGAMNPKYNNFIQRDDYGNIIGYNPKKASADPVGFQQFVTEIEKMQNQSLMNMPHEEDFDDIDAEFEEN